MKGQQLPLAMAGRVMASFESFHPGPNAAVLATLRSERNVYLVGNAGTGKTHLLQSLVRERGGIYLPLRELGPYGPEALRGSEEQSLLALDDVDAVIAQPDWSLALLRLLDARRREERATVVACVQAPGLLPALADLRTRLSQLTLLTVQPLDDADHTELLRERAQSRGLELPDEVSRYLLTRLPRDTQSLLAALETLDRASLTAQRRLTIPFVQSVLAV